MEWSGNSPSLRLNIPARIERLPVTWFTWKIILLAGFAWFIESLSIGSLGVILEPIKQTMHLDAEKTGLLTASSTFGIVVGLIPAGFLADRIGRKRMLIWGIATYSLLTLLCAFSANYGMLLAFRFLSGIGMGAVFPLPYAIVSEFVSSRRRALCNGLMDACLSIGYFLAPLLGFLILPNFTDEISWRVFFAVSALPVLYALLIRFFLPESPHWLARKGRYAEAQDVMQNIEEQIERFTSRQLPVPDRSDPAPQVWREEPVTAATPWKKPYLRRTLARSIAAVGTFFMFYIVMTYMPILFVSRGFTFAHSLQYTAIITAAAIPGKLLNGYLAERIGRKSVFILFMGLAGIACLFFGLAVTSGAMIFYASVMSFCGTGAFPALKMSYAEQYPSSLRTTGAATVETLGRFFGGVVGSFIMPFLLNDKAAASGFYIVAAVAFAAIVVEVVFSPETKGYTLEQLESGALDQGGRL